MDMETQAAKCLEALGDKSTAGVPHGRAAGIHTVLLK